MSLNTVESFFDSTFEKFIYNVDTIFCTKNSVGKIKSDVNKAPAKHRDIFR